MSFLGRIFPRTAGPAPKQRADRTSAARDSEVWQVGDWAECINLGQWFVAPAMTPGEGPRHGRIGQVTGVRVLRFGHDRILALSFASWPGNFYAASQFRKLHPRADAATAAEAEFTALVRRRPAGQPAPALPRETIEEFQ